MSDAIAYATIRELGARYRRRELSPVEVTQALLARIAKLDPALHAFVTVTAERALADARAAETALGRGPRDRLRPARAALHRPQLRQELRHQHVRLAAALGTSSRCTHKVGWDTYAEDRRQEARGGSRVADLQGGPRRRESPVDTLHSERLRGLVGPHTHAQRLERPVHVARVVREERARDLGAASRERRYARIGRRIDPPHLIGHHHVSDYWRASVAGTHP